MSGDDPLTAVDDAGRTTAQLAFRDGVAEGPARAYDEVGRCRLDAGFVAGQLDGPAEVRSLDARVLRLGFRRGVPDGLLESFDPATGALALRATYRSGVLDGPFALFRDDGSASRRCNYRAGKLHGELVDYGADGAEVRRVRYEDGRPVIDPPPEMTTDADLETLETGTPWYRRLVLW